MKNWNVDQSLVCFYHILSHAQNFNIASTTFWEKQRVTSKWNEWFVARIFRFACTVFLFFSVKFYSKTECCQLLNDTIIIAIDEWVILGYLKFDIVQLPHCSRMLAFWSCFLRILVRTVEFSRHKWSCVILASLSLDVLCKYILYQWIRSSTNQIDFHSRVLEKMLIIYHTLAKRT